MPARTGLNLLIRKMDTKGEWVQFLQATSQNLCHEVAVYVKEGIVMKETAGPHAVLTAPERMELAATTLCLKWFLLQGTGFINHCNCREHKCRFNLCYLTMFPPILCPRLKLSLLKDSTSLFLKEHHIAPVSWEDSFVVSPQHPKKPHWGCLKNGNSVEKWFKKAPYNLGLKAGI